MLPIIRSAVEGVLEALHPDLITVVDTGHAGIGHLPERRHEKAARAERELLRRHAYARLLDRRHPLVVGNAGKHGNRALHIVATDEVHHRVEIFPGVVLDLTGEAPRRLPSVQCTCEKVEPDRAQRIVHRRVHLIAREIFARRPIGDFVRRVLPDLADHDGVRVALFKLCKKRLGEGRRQFIDHVEAPACDALLHPVMEHAVLARNDEVHIGGIGLIDVRQRVKVPPAVILIRIAAKTVPRVVRRLLRLIGTERMILLLPVEVDAVAARVAEHAVENDTDAALPGSRDEAAKILDIAKHGINFMIIARVVVMVALRLKNRIEVDARNPKILQIVQLFHNPAQVAAEEIIRDDLLCIGVLQIHGIVCPIRTDDRALFAYDHITRACEAIRKDLVHDGVFEPVGGVRALIVDCDLIGCGRRIAQGADTAQHLLVVPVKTGLVCHRDDEVIPKQTAVIRQLEPAGIEALLSPRILRLKGNQAFPRPILPQTHQHLAHRLIAADADAEAYPAARLRRADDRAVIDIL